MRASILGAAAMAAVLLTGVSWAGDSTSIPRLLSADVGYTLPNANRSASAAHAAQADHAANSDRAGHADTASRLQGDGDDRGAPEYVCGSGGKASCGRQVSLPHGIYLARCSSGGGEDRVDEVKTITIFGGTGAYASCPAQDFGYAGISGGNIRWIRKF